MFSQCQIVINETKFIRKCFQKYEIKYYQNILEECVLVLEYIRIMYLRQGFQLIE